jgi:3-ketosteroid 9alpha-monooxygenase subunit B
VTSPYSDETDHSSALFKYGFHPIRVSRIVDETSDTRSLVLDVPADLRELFRYRPGQYCTFRVHVGDEELLRSYSMSSAPGLDADLTVTVKRVVGGRVSNWMNDCVSVGDVLEVSKPAGVFCPTDRNAPVLAFAGGSGITPVFSIIKDVLANTGRTIRLLYANRDRESVIFRSELDRLRSNHPERLAVIHHIDADSGYLSNDDVVAFIGDELDSDAYVCGPTPFMDLAERGLLHVGFDPSRIAIERFADGAVTSQNPLPSSALEVGDDDDDHHEGAAAAITVPESITLIVKGRKNVVPYRAGTTVLDTARSAGVATPFSCELGNCATCMAFVKVGTVAMRTNQALSATEVVEGWVLTCQGIPQGETVVVEFEDM